LRFAAKWLDGANTTRQMIDYTKIDAEKLENEIYHRQQMGPEGRTQGIVRITCRCCPESIDYPDVHRHWQSTYKPQKALPCTMCGQRPILTASCSWHGVVREDCESRVDVSYWIECKCGCKQEFRAEWLIPWPPASKSLRTNGAYYKVSYHTALQLIGEWNRSLRHSVKARTM
jgi:hypothetical protein